MITSRLRRVSTLAIFVACVALTACTSTPHSESSGEYVDDTTITAKVKAAVLGDPNLKSAEINVETFKGRVQLSGFVRSQADIDRALVLARNIKGVRTVANDMRLK